MSESLLPDRIRLHGLPEPTYVYYFGLAQRVEYWFFIDDVRFWVRVDVGMVDWHGIEIWFCTDGYCRQWRFLDDSDGWKSAEDVVRAAFMGLLREDLWSNN